MQRPVDVLQPRQRTLEQIRINPGDGMSLMEASDPRTPADYTPMYLQDHPFMLPANVYRGLASPTSLARLNQAASSVPISDFHMILSRHRLGNTMVPLHVGTGFTYTPEGSKGSEALQRPIRIAGPQFVSTLHVILSSKTIPMEEKVRIVEKILGEYVGGVKDYDVTVMRMPRRNYTLPHSLDIRDDTSLTHTLLLRAAGGVGNYRDLGDTSGAYFFAHGKEENVEMREALLQDPNLEAIFEPISTAWSANFARENEKGEPDPELFEAQCAQVIEMLSQG